MKDSFGGIIPTFRARCGTISPVMVGVGALAAATGAVSLRPASGPSTLSDFATKRWSHPVTLPG